MNKQSLLLLSTLLISLASCNSQVRKVSITLTLEEKVQVEKDKEHQMKLTITPDTYPAYKEVTWESNDPNIASISSSGSLKGISYGETTVKVTSKYDTSKSATSKIIVGTPITSIDLNNPTGLYLYKGSSYTFMPTILPANCPSEVKDLVYSSSDSSIVNIDNDGIATALKAGQVTITASSKVYPSVTPATCVVTVSETPIDPTGITLSKTSLSLRAGKSESLKVSYTPTNANRNKDITWTSSDENVATVDKTGTVTIKENAEEKATCKITATLTNIPSISQTCSIEVAPKTNGQYTVFIYMCGSTLESKDNMYLATKDITEMLEATNQPEDVHVVIETGGSTKWSTEYNISSKNLQRWHVRDQKLVLDETLTGTYSSMGNASTLQDFLTWGLNKYGSDTNSLILWNHGGGMQGVCYDEVADSRYLSSRLYNSEVKSAVSNALSATDYPKFDWIGYDACLMSVQDIADFNSSIANYMIASQESENGYGWEYTTWLNKLFANPLIESAELMTSIVDSYIKDAHDYAEYWKGQVNDDGTIAVIDLNETKIANYCTAWEAFAESLSKKITSKTVWSQFTNVINKGLRFGASEDTYHQIVYPFDVYDVQVFINKLKASSLFSSLTTELTNVETALKDLIYLNKYNTYYTSSTGLPCGLNLFCPTSDYTALSEFYPNQSNYTTWIELVKKYGAYQNN